MEESIHVDIQKGDVESASSEEAPQVFRTYKIRFFGLTMIALANISSAMNWLAVAPVPDFANSFFNNCGLSTINWFSNIFMLCYVVAGPLSSWVYDRWSLKVGLITGTVLQTIGAWLRYFSSFVNYPTGKLALALIGQTFCAIGQPFILNASTPYAAQWFSADGRATASMISGLVSGVGMAISDLIIPAIVTDTTQLPMGFLCIACITTGLTIPNFFIPKKPKTPPSYSAYTKEEHTLSFKDSLLSLVTNRNFLLIFTSFSIIAGLTNTVTSLLAQIVIPYGVSVDQAGYLGAAFIVAGLVGGFSCGYLIDKTRRHILIIKIFVPILGCMYLGLIFVVKENGYAGIMAICTILGFFTFALLPASLELSVECSYPVSESVSSSFLWMGSQILGLAFILSMDALREDNGNPPGNMRRALIMAASMVLPMSIVIFIYNSPNRRLEYEKREKEGEDS
ncbi:MFS general substrate transporter [Backusella circina FSU 941]|nr:MFS general substrate transporter [Backusella circina FSU 941]